MNKVSELLSKPIISIFDAKIVGTIGNIYFDSKMTKGVILSIFDDEASDVEEKFVELAKVVSIESDAAVIKDSSYVTYGWNTKLGAVNPINSPAYTQDGKLLGSVRDIIMDGAKIMSFIVDSREIAASTLLSHSNSALVFNDSGRPLKPPPKRKIPKETTRQKIELHYPPASKQSHTKQEIVNQKNRITPAQEGKIFEVDSEKIGQAKIEKIDNFDEILGENIEIAIRDEIDAKEIVDVKIVQAEQVNGEQKSTQTVQEEPATIGVPQKVSQSLTNVPKTSQPSNSSRNASTQNDATLGKFSFLLGKLLEENLYSDDGTILVRSNTLITAEVIALCKIHSRLVQLALHSRSNDQ